MKTTRNCPMHTETLEDGRWRCECGVLNTKGALAPPHFCFACGAELVEGGTPTTRVVLQRGDITQVSVDAIVNAANERLLGGGGVDGAIHRAAGPRLLEACRHIPEITDGVRCRTGESRITPAFNLNANAIIHTVGPVYRHMTSNSSTRPDGIPPHPDPPAALASCYRSALTLAEDWGHTRIAMPAISCGVYGYPVEEAAQIAKQVIEGHDWDIVEVRFILFDERAYEGFRAVFEPAPPPEDLSSLEMP
jgi:O-acetyl-ADP-ribose deacetylase (regulator of RNase III)